MNFTRGHYTMRNVASPRIAGPYCHYRWTMRKYKELRDKWYDISEDEYIGDIYPNAFYYERYLQTLNKVKKLKIIVEISTYGKTTRGTFLVHASRTRTNNYSILTNASNPTDYRIIWTPNI